MPKTMSVRLDDEQAVALEMVAAADDQAMAETVRDALEAHIESRKNDQEFQTRLNNITKRNAKVLKRLAQ